MSRKPLNSSIGLFDSPSYILFDFETTGLRPPKDKPLQLAYILLNSSFQVLEAKNFYFQIQKEVPLSATKIHGLTKAKLLALGAMPLDYHLEEIQSDFSVKNILPIAHNASFDALFLKNFFLKGVSLKLFCTMKYYTNIIKLPGQYNDFKWPKVSETMQFLHIDEKQALLTCKELFLSDSIGYHDARFDIVCILKMIQEDSLLRDRIFLQQRKQSSEPYTNIKTKDKL